MSTTVDERVLQMRFDNRQFESNIHTSLNSLQQLERSLNLTGATKGLENIGEAAKNCNVSSLGNAVEAVGVKFSALQVMAVTALANITNTAINTGKKIVNALAIDPIRTGFQEYETQINAVQTILANTSSKGTTLNQVNKALDELNHYADMTIYNFTEMTRNIGTFTAAGVDLDTSVSAIKGIANLAAVSGSTSQQASTAMYQLSQALAAGTVKLQDWNSVVNAGMGGQVFQDSLKETARVHGIAIDKMIESEGSFRETLSKGWLTSEILTETLAKFTGDLNEDQLRTMGYADEQIASIIKMGQTANDAATKVKTFTQLFDTLEEAAQSGWTQSWEIIVGDFEEAKEFLTEISDTFGGLINASSDARNAVLSKGLSSGWKQFLEEGIGDEEGYKEAVISVAKEHGIAVDKMIEDAGSFEKSLKQGWLTSDILSESLAKLTDKTRGLSDEELKALGYTREQVTALEELELSVQNGTVSLEEFADKMSMASGRENLIDALRNAFEGVVSVVTPVKEAFREIFPPITGEQLYTLTEKIKELTSRFKVSGDTAENLKNTFKGVFAMVDIVKQGFLAAFNAVLPLSDGLTSLASGFLSVTGTIGSWVVKLDEAIKGSCILHGIVQTTAGFLGGLIQFAKNAFVFPGLESFHVLLDRLRERMSQIQQTAGGLKAALTSAMAGFGSTASGNSFIQGFQTLFQGVKAIADGIVNVVSSLTDKVSEKLASINFSGLVDMIGSLSLGGIAVAVAKFLSNLTKPLEDIDGLLDGVTGILDGVRGCFEAYQTQLKAGALLKIAGAIAILAGSIVVISLIDSAKLAGATAAISVLFADLMASMAIFARISGDLKGVLKSCAAMVTMSTAVLIMASALKKIGDLDMSHITSALLGLSVISGIMVETAKILGSEENTVIKGAGSMVIFAAAMRVLASVCKSLAELEWEQLKIGLTGVGALMAEMALFLKFANTESNLAPTAAGMILLAGAMKILASACKDFGQMQIEEIGKGLAGIGGLLLEIAAFAKLTGNTKIALSSGVALITISAAMKIFASAVQDMSHMDLEGLGRGLLGMAGALASVTLALNFMPANTIGIGTGLIAVSAALLVMAKALGSMGKMSWDEMARGLIALAGAMTILAVGLNAMSGAMVGSAALLVATAALGAFLPVLALLGAMPVSAMVKSLLLLAGTFTVLGAAAVILTPLAPAILALTASLLAFGTGVTLVGAGVTLLGTGIALLAASLAAVAASGTAAFVALANGLQVLAESLLNIIPVLAVSLKDALLAIVDMLVQAAPAIVEGALVILTAVCESIAEYAPKIAEAALLLLYALLEAIFSHIYEITDLVVAILTAFLTAVSDNIEPVVMAGVTLIISFVDALANTIREKTPELLQAVENLMSALIEAVLTALQTLLGNIPVVGEKIDGALETVKQDVRDTFGVEEMRQIGSDAAQGIADGISSQNENLNASGKGLAESAKAGASSGISEFIDIGKNFGKSFSDSLNESRGEAKTSGEAVSGAGSEEIENKVGDYEEAGIHSGEGFVQGIKSKVSDASRAGSELGSAALSATQNVLDTHSPSKEYEEIGKNVDEGFAIGIEKNADMAENAANELGIKAIKPVEKAAQDVNVIIENMPFGTDILEVYLKKYEGVASAHKASKASVEAASKAILQYGQTLYEESEQYKKDTETLEKHREELEKLKETRKSLEADIAKGGTKDKNVKSLTSDLKKNEEDIKKMNEQIAQDFKDSAQHVADIYNDLKASISDSVKGFIDPLKISLDTQVDLFTAFGEDTETTKEEILANMDSQIKGVTKWNQELDKLAEKGVATGLLEKLREMGPQSAGYVHAFMTMTTGEIEKANDAFRTTTEMTADTLITGFTDSMNKVQEWSKNLSELSKRGLNQGVIEALGNMGVSGAEYVNAFLSMSGEQMDEFNSKYAEYLSLPDNVSNEIISTFAEAGKGASTEFNKNLLGLTNPESEPNQEVNANTVAIGEGVDQGVIVGMENKREEVQSQAKKVSESGEEGLTTHLNRRNGSSIGSDVCKGLIQGLAAGKSGVINEAVSVAIAAYKAAKAALDIESPSKKFAELGMYSDIGFAKGLSLYAYRVSDASEGVAESALKGLSNSIGRISTMVTDGMDTEPVIRPVIDLSNIEEGAGLISDLLNPNSGIRLANVEQRLSGVYGRTKSEDSGVSEAQNNTQVQKFEFTQNNYSPKALSRTEIYRQTRNQLSILKGAVYT